MFSMMVCKLPRSAASMARRTSHSEVSTTNAGIRAAKDFNTAGGTESGNLKLMFLTINQR
ncbi:hypothetical protein D3C73_1555890 [compost metagenome]